MKDFGPLYCETLINNSTNFPIEPVNTVTNIFAVVLGLAVIFWLYKSKKGNKILYLMAFGVFATGLGSTLWHGFRTSLSLALDVYPGLITFLMVICYWPYLLGGRWWSYATIATIFGGVFAVVKLLPFLDNHNGPPVGMFFVLGAVGFTLSFLTYKKTKDKLFLISIAFLTTAILAAVARTADLSTCSLIPFGTHFLWHVFLGTTGAVAVVFLALLNDKVKS
jgi:energy-converting hydrogenase Eha subunit E